MQSISMIRMAIILLAYSIGNARATPQATFKLPGDISMDFIWIEPGTFTMGTTFEQQALMQAKGWWAYWMKEEQPAHQVTITHGFWLGKYEVTQAQWVAIMATRPWTGQPWAQDNPGNASSYILWPDAQALVQRLNQAAGDSLYRLPTEAEWEYACKAGTTTLWSFGDDPALMGQYGWYAGNAWNVDQRYAHPVGQKKPNPWGLYDMHGNVYEWCQDTHNRSYSVGPRSDPIESRPSDWWPGIHRGGQFGMEALYARSACRAYDTPDYQHPFGTRLLRLGPSPTSVEPSRWGSIKSQAE